MHEYCFNMYLNNIIGKSSMDNSYSRDELDALDEDQAQSKDACEMCVVM